MNISYSFEFNCCSKTLYEAIAEPASVAHWWTDDFAFDPKVAVATYHWRKFGWTVQMLIKDIQPHALVAWQCISSNMQNTAAWLDSAITFKISPISGNKSRIDFLHDDYKNSPCYDECNAGWAFVLGNSLKSFVETGAGKPFRNFINEEEK